MGGRFEGSQRQGRGIIEAPYCPTVYRRTQDLDAVERTREDELLTEVSRARQHQQSFLACEGYHASGRNAKTVSACTSRKSSRWRRPPPILEQGCLAGRVVKVGDFGLAKAFAESGLSGGTWTGDVGGTYEFMCRQQVAYHNDAGPEVDVWSLAATMYYQLTGNYPRDFGDGDSCLAVLEVDPTPIGKRRSDLPPRLAEVIDAALKEEPEMTFKTAIAFKRALEDAM
jgi:serine/threonine protein kinase